MKINVINRSKHKLPEYTTEHAAGMDIRANLENDVVLEPLARVLIPTGIYMELPVGYEAQIRPRSGLAINKGISVLNSPGTIDSDYRGEVRIILINLSSEPFIVRDGDRICQMIISRYERAEWIDSDTLLNTERGEGGFGHTGKE